MHSFCSCTAAHMLRVSVAFSGPLSASPSHSHATSPQLRAAAAPLAAPSRSCACVCVRVCVCVLSLLLVALSLCLSLSLPPSLSLTHCRGRLCWPQPRHNAQRAAAAAAAPSARRLPFCRYKSLKRKGDSATERERDREGNSRWHWLPRSNRTVARATQPSPVPPHRSQKTKRRATPS